LHLCLDVIDAAVVAATEEAHDHGTFSWFLELLELPGLPELPVAASTMPSTGGCRWLA
jgi:6,7-dimethyl-8-ribityllumazine synthase